MLRADLHIHTEYSMDCSTPLEDIIKRCQETGINCIAIADHNSVEGALKMQELAPFPVIVAEEILTPNGEIMGMFLSERIPSGVTVEEAISGIKAQGGLVCLPHPFDTFRGLRLDGKKLEELAEQIDVIEVFNARSQFASCSKKAQSFAEKYDIPGSAGSDAHSSDEIGNTYIELPEFKDRDDFLKALKKGNIHSHPSGLFVHFKTTWTKIKKAF
jgi:predicted metal-dependent phosphoesterase TrpH